MIAIMRLRNDFVKAALRLHSYRRAIASMIAGMPSRAKTPDYRDVLRSQLGSGSVQGNPKDG